LLGDQQNNVTLLMERDSELSSKVKIISLCLH